MIIYYQLKVFHEQSLVKTTKCPIFWINFAWLQIHYEFWNKKTIFLLFSISVCFLKCFTQVRFEILFLCFKNITKVYSNYIFNIWCLFPIKILSFPNSNHVSNQHGIVKKSHRKIGLFSGFHSYFNGWSLTLKY